MWPLFNAVDAVVFARLPLTRNRSDISTVLLCYDDCLAHPRELVSAHLRIVVLLVDFFFEVIQLRLNLWVNVPSFL